MTEPTHVGLLAATEVDPSKIRVVERRRPGRIENASPELISLMRKPSKAVIEQIALYDAPYFVLPEPNKGNAEISFLKLAHFAVAFGLCAIGWTVAFKMMILNWG